MTNVRIDLRTKIMTPANPFPGPRPFERSESHLFFGRDGQSEQMIAKLDATRFLAVVGASGSGKSSLVFAGLLPALHGGLMAEAGSAWRVAIMRPRNDPIGNLARALNEPEVFGSDVKENRALQTAITEATLRRGSRGLVDAARDVHMPSSENLLVVADQFEELFRIPRETGHDELENDKAAFVKLLLDARKRRPEGPNIYVVLTMRSDYLGDCAQFWDLPEAINEGQYLIPRLTREQRREAITGPVAVGNAEITPGLVNRLLNDVGDNPDQLPILQHALMRTWGEWKREKETGGQGDKGTGRPEDDKNPQSFPIDLRHYDAIGGMAQALSVHANEAFNELSPRRKQIAEKMFKCLTEKGADNREGRRPTTIDKIRAVAEADEGDVITVIETFRKAGRSFLVASTGEELNAKSLIDISHESLIRNWQGSEEKDETKRLKEWVDDEARSARIYRRLAETAVLHQRGEAALWGDPDLQLALNWRERQKPNRAWAQRYHPDFDLAERFLENSRDARDAEILAEQNRQARELRRSRIFASVLSVALILSLIALFYAWRQQRLAEERKQTAEEQRKVAEEQKRDNRRLYYNASINLAKNAFDQNETIWGHNVLARLLDDPDGLRGFEWHHFRLRYPKGGITLGGQGLPVLSVAFSRDGKMLASGGEDGSLKLWEVNNASEKAMVKAHDTAILSVAFSPDGKKLASGGADGSLKCWDTDNVAQPAAVISHGGGLRSIAFSPNGKVLASGGADGNVKLWDANDGRPKGGFKAHEKALLSVAISRDGKWLASGSEDGTAKLWDLSGNKEVAAAPSIGSPVRSVAFSPAEEMLVIGSEDGLVRFTDYQMKVVKSAYANTPIRAVAFSTNGKRLAGGGASGSVILWETVGAQRLTALVGHSDRINSVAFSPDGRMATGSNDTTVKLWETSDSSETIFTHNAAVHAVVYSLDAKRLASAGEDGTVKLWNAENGQTLEPFSESGRAFFAAAFSPNGERLAAGADNGTIRLWDLNSRQLLATLKGHGRSVKSVAFDPSGKRLASGGEDGKIMLWEASGGKELATLEGPGTPAWAVAFSPDGKRLAAGVADGTVKIWEMNGAKEPSVVMRHGNQVRTIAFSPDGKKLGSGGGDGAIKLWDAGSGKELMTLGGYRSPITSVAFSRDSKRLASASMDGKVKLWETDKGQEIVTLIAKRSAIRSVAFSPDGKSLACGGDDKAVTLYFAAAEEDAARPK